MLLYKKSKMRCILVIVLIISLYKVSNADIGKETGLKIPRYISIKSNDANIRIGPSKNYPIVLKYIKKNYPLKIIEEYQEWRKVEDFEKNTGWIHKSLISGKRTGLILSDNYGEIKVLNTIDGIAIGSVGKYNIILINKCKINWCSISINEHKGWIKKKNIWGIEKNEIYKISFYQNIIDFYWGSINYLQNVSKKF